MFLNIQGKFVLIEAFEKWWCKYDKLFTNRVAVFVLV